MKVDISTFPWGLMGRDIHQHKSTGWHDKASTVVNVSVPKGQLC